ncbi:hypothetical protein QUB60_18135 [Microcoleus sp. A2-C5]|nr:hypothetical protein [Lyngbya sp. CCAP 1446/10]
MADCQTLKILPDLAIEKLRSGAEPPNFDLNQIVFCLTHTVND